MSRLKRSVAALLCLLLVGICAFAEEIDPDRTCSLTVRCRYKVEGVVYSLWRVADVDEDVQFTLTSDFRKSRAKVNDLSEDGWQEAAEVLARWAEKKDIPADNSRATDRDGEACFRRLETGLYLVIGDGYTYQDQAYEQDPFLIALPTRSDAEEAWEYDVVTRRKPAEKVDSGVIDVEVLKVWRNDDQALRPMSVTVQLLKDGQVEDTAVLSIKNNWRCIWKGLPDDHTWRISEEDVPEGYTVLIRRDGDSYTIINTAEPDQSDRPIQPVDPTNPTNPTNPTKPTKPVSPGRPGDLPVTGTLWWMVPLLGGLGAGLFVLGLLRRRREG